jgi:hypothetical protein
MVSPFHFFLQVGVKALVSQAGLPSVFGKKYEGRIPVRRERTRFAEVCPDA